jgi:hypothetical protein
MPSSGNCQGPRRQMRLFMLIVERNFGIGVDTFRPVNFFHESIQDVIGETAPASIQSVNQLREELHALWWMVSLRARRSFCARYCGSLRHVYASHPRRPSTSHRIETSADQRRIGIGIRPSSDARCGAGRNLTRSTNLVDHVINGLAQERVIAVLIAMTTVGLPREPTHSVASPRDTAPESQTA